MSSAQRQVAEMLDSVEGARAFIEWIGMDTTQVMLRAAREMAQPKAPELPDPTSLILGYGKTLGANEVVDFLMNPAAHGRMAMRSAPTLGQPTYGAQGILKDQALPESPKSAKA